MEFVHSSSSSTSSSTNGTNGYQEFNPVASPLLSNNDQSPMHHIYPQQQQQQQPKSPLSYLTSFTSATCHLSSTASSSDVSYAAYMANNRMFTVSNSPTKPSALPYSPLISSKSSSSSDAGSPLLYNSKSTSSRSINMFPSSSYAPTPTTPTINNNHHYHQPSLLEESVGYLNESVSSPRKPHRLSIKEKNSEEGRRKRNESMNQIRKIKREDNAISKRMYNTSNFSDDAESMDANNIENKTTTIASSLSNQTHYPSEFNLNSSNSSMLNGSNHLSVATTSMLEHNPHAHFNKNAFFNPQSFAGDRVKQPHVLSERLRQYPPPDPVLEVKFAAHLQSILTNPLSAQSIPIIMEVLSNPFSASEEALAMMLKSLRKLISVSYSSPIDPAIEAGVLVHLCNFLEHPSSRIQYEACWCLTNIASTPRTNAVVEVGAIPLVGQLMFSSDADIREQCAWCLGNIMGDCTEYRDAVMNQVPFALRMLCDQVTNPSSTAMLRTATWAISNFTRGRPPPPAETVWFAIPILVNLLKTCDDGPTKLDAFWGICYFSNASGTPIIPPQQSQQASGDPSKLKADTPPIQIDHHIGERKIQFLIELGLAPIIVSALTAPHDSSSKHISPALKIAGNITSSKNPAHTDALILSGIGNVIPILLSHPLATTKKETCWMFSNICAGTAEQIRGVLNTNINTLEKLLNCFKNESYDVRREALWCFMNIVQKGHPDDVKHIVSKCGLLRIFSKELSDSTTAPNIIIHALKSCERLLQLDLDRYSHEFEENDLITTIENLQSHVDQEVFSESSKIIQTYFGDDEASMDVLLPSVSNSTGMFTFSPNIQSGFSQQEQTSIQFYNHG